MMFFKYWTSKIIINDAIHFHFARSAQLLKVISLKIANGGYIECRRNKSLQNSRNEYLHLQKYVFVKFP